MGRRGTLTATIARYTHAAYFDVVKASGVSHADLRGAMVWTEALREARNAVHHGTAAPPPATWETTAALLMGAVPNLRLLWAARGTAGGTSPAAGQSARTRTI